jgi:amidohydrolase
MIDSNGDPKVAAWLAEHTEGLVAFRRNLHSHPELSGEEFATTELVSERLAVAGLESRVFASGTGLVCDLDPVGGSDSQPRLALRADLDALAMHDEKDVPYRSQNDGVAHACGHDVHTAITLGAALYYSHRRDQLPGPLRFIFQPAEERVPGGALDVISDGGIDGVDAIVGLHCDPKLDVGRVGLKAGPISSAADMAEIALSGPGGHTARPEETVDLITIAGSIVNELPGLVRSALSSPDLVKVVFGSIHAGDAANVVPSHCHIRASVRTPSLDVWETLPGLIDASLRDLLGDTGADYVLDYTHGVPPVVNDPAVIGVAEAAVKAELGERAVAPAVQSWGGDDFAWFTRQRPGAYLRLGVHDPTTEGPMLDLHAGHFDVDERSIPVGVRLLTSVVASYFGVVPGHS